MSISLKLLMSVAIFLCFRNFKFQFSAHNKGDKVYNYGCYLTPTTWTWNWNKKMEGIGKLGEDSFVGNASVSFLSANRCSTIERLYACGEACMRSSTKFTRTYLNS